MVIRSTFLFPHWNRESKIDDPVIISHRWQSQGGGGGAVAPIFCQIFAKSPFFASNFGISMLTAPPPHIPVSPRTFKFTPPSM